MPKSVKIILAAVIFIFIAAAVTSYIFFKPAKKTDDPSQPVWAEIVVDGKVVEKIDLSSAEDRVFRIETDNGWNEITIKGGQISITDADCPDHTCVKTGILRSEYVPIVCLPHKLIIRYCS